MNARSAAAFKASISEGTSGPSASVVATMSLTACLRNPGSISAPTDVGV